MLTNIVISKFWSRIWAFVLDLLFLGIFGYLLGMFFQDHLYRIGTYALLYGFVIAVIYQTIFNSNIGNGQTFGKRIMNIQVVDINGNTIQLSKSFYRSVLFCLPYFLKDLQLPGEMPLSVLNMLKSGTLSLFLVGIGIVYLFNKQTRQSIHDLLVGTYVVSTERSEESVELAPLSKKPFYIFGAVILLGTVLTFFMKSQNEEDLKDVNLIYTELSKIEEGNLESVIYHTNLSNGQTTNTLKVGIRVIDMPEPNTNNNPFINKVAQSILSSSANIDQYDYIQISLIKAFDMGIASNKTENSFKQTPNEWRELLK